MVAAELTASGKAKRYKTWEAALLWAMRGVEYQRHNADTEHRAREFARTEPEGARRIMLELAEGASDIGDIEAMRVYLNLIADMQRWLESCTNPRDPWDDEPEPEPYDEKQDAIALLEAEGYTVRAPGTRAKKRKKAAERAVLEPDEVESLYRAIGRRGYSTVRNRAMIGVMLYAGLRVGEACSLRPDAIRIEGNVAIIAVPDSDGAKTGARTAMLRIRHADGTPTRAWQDFERFMEKRTEGDYLFTTLQGTRTAEHSVRRALKRYAEDAKIAKLVTPHVLRHTYGTNLGRSGVEPDAIRALMGHKDVATSAIYWHTNEKRMIEVTGRL